VRSKSK